MKKFSFVFVIAFVLTFGFQAAWASPGVLHSFTTVSTVHNLEADGNKLYIAAGTSGLAVYDVTNPGYPILTHYPTDGDVRDTFIYGDRLFVSDAEEGLLVYDLDDLNNTIASISVPNTTWEVRVVDDYAYIQGNYQISIVDLNATTPGVVGTVDTDALANEGIRGFAVRDDVLYLAHFNGYEIETFDLTDKTDPSPRGQYNIESGLVQDIELRNSYLYVITHITTMSTTPWPPTAGFTAIPRRSPSTGRTTSLSPPRGSTAMPLSSILSRWRSKS